jgi:hypothetical protein
MTYNYICETMDVIYWFAVSGEHQWMFGNVVRNGTPWYTQNPITPYLLGHCLLHASMASHWVNEVWFLLLGLPTEGLKSICYVYIFTYVCYSWIWMEEWCDPHFEVPQRTSCTWFPKGSPHISGLNQLNHQELQQIVVSQPPWPNKHVVNMLSPPILRQNGCHSPCFIQSVFPEHPIPSRQFFNSLTWAATVNRSCTFSQCF